MFSKECLTCLHLFCFFLSLLMQNARHVLHREDVWLFLSVRWSVFVAGEPVVTFFRHYLSCPPSSPSPLEVKKSNQRLSIPRVSFLPRLLKSIFPLPWFLCKHYWRLKSCYLSNGVKLFRLSHKHFTVLAKSEMMRGYLLHEGRPDWWWLKCPYYNSIYTHVWLCLTVSLQDSRVTET